MLISCKPQSCREHRCLQVVCHSGLQKTASGGRSAGSFMLLRMLPPPVDRSSKAASAELTGASATSKLSLSPAISQARESPAAAAGSSAQLPTAAWVTRSFGGGDGRATAHSAVSLPSNGLLTRSIAATTRRRRAASSGLRHSHKWHDRSVCRTGVCRRERRLNRSGVQYSILSHTHNQLQSCVCRYIAPCVEQRVPHLSAMS